VASSSTRWELSDFFRIASIADLGPTATLIGIDSSTASSSIIGRSVGSETTISSAFPARRCGTKPYRSIRSAGIDRNRS